MKVRKLLVSLSLVLILTVAAMMVACTPTPAPTTSPTATPTPTAAPTAVPTQTAAPTSAPTQTTAPSTKVYTLSFAHHTNNQGPFGQIADWYLKEVEKRTNGRVQFERYWSNALIDTKEAPTGLKTGIVDFAHMTGSYHAGLTPLLNMGQLPLPYAEQYSAMYAWYDLLRTNKAYIDELAKFNAKMITVSGSSPFGLIVTKKIDTVTNLTGLKIRAMGDTARLVQALGGTPVSMTGPECTDAMAKGVLDGVACNPSFSVAYSFQDVGKYFFNGFNLQGNLTTMAMNIDVWNSLPPDIQKIMIDLVPEHIKASMQGYGIDGDKKGIDAMLARKVVVGPVTAAEAKTVADKAAVVNGSWIADRAKEGLPGQQVYDTWIQLYEKYLPTSPFKQNPDGTYSPK